MMTSKPEKDQENQITKQTIIPHEDVEKHRDLLNPNDSGNGASLEHRVESLLSPNKEKCSLILDTSIAERQLSELMDLLKSRFPKGIPNELVSNFAGLSLDIFFTDRRSTLGADGSIEVFQGFRFGSGFESLRTAILAGKWDIHISH